MNTFPGWIVGYGRDLGKCSQRAILTSKNKASYYGNPAAVIIDIAARGGFISKHFVWHFIFCNLFCVLSTIQKTQPFINRNRFTISLMCFLMAFLGPIRKIAPSEKIEHIFRGLLLLFR
jgi:hypothetical protein